MGRKINPLLFRSKYKFKKINWVDNTNKYKNFIEEDSNVQSLIYNYFNKKNIKINSIYLFRKQTSIKTTLMSMYIIIFLSKTEKKKLFNEVFYLKHLIKNILKNNYLNINVKVSKIKIKQKVTEKFNLFISKLDKGLSIKLSTSNFITELQEIKQIIGAKIEIMGRINGSEKARKLKTQYGIIGLQKILSKICLLTKTIKTKDGIINIKFTYKIK